MVQIRLLVIPLMVFLLFAAISASADPDDLSPDALPPVYYPTDGPWYPTEFPTEYPTFFPTDSPVITIEPTPIGNEYGWVSVYSVPSGAWVTFDGSPQGTTPVHIQVLTTGSPFHQIYLSLDGYQEWSTSLSENPGPDQTIPVHADLVPLPPTPTPTLTPTPSPTITPSPTPTLIGPDYGWYYIESVPSGAEITFDGIYQGSAPVQVQVYTTGTPSHQVLARMNGYYDWKTTLSRNPASFETIPLTASLVPRAEFGSIRVTSTPSGSIAILDGGNQDLTPCTFYDVQPGIHKIKVIRDGYQPYTEQVRVTTAGQSQVSASLSPIQKTGTLYVTSSPSGADILLDGVYQGETPYTVYGSAGSHDLVLKLAGYQRWTSGVTIDSGRQNSVHASMTALGPATGSLQVSSTPRRSSVFLDESYYGQTPEKGYLDIPDLKPGSYQARITHPQNQDYSGTVAITAGQVTTLNVALSAAPAPSAVNGTLMVSSHPSGATILLDNRFIGITPLSVPSVGPGDHTLILRMDGYEDAVKQVTITAGGVTDVMVDMIALTPEPTMTPSPEPTMAGQGLALSVIGVIGAALLLGYASKNRR